MVLLVVLLTAAIFDVLYRRIPNWLTVSGVVLGIAMNTADRYARGRDRVLAGRAGGRVRDLCGTLLSEGNGRGRRKADGGRRGAGRVGALVRNLLRHRPHRRSHGA